MKAFIILVTVLFFAAAGFVGLSGLACGGDGARRSISPVELSRHASPSDCWIAIGQGVYDVTGYIDEHPAGASTITNTCGTDATIAFETKNVGRAHSGAARAKLEKLRVGDYDARPH